MKNLNLNNLKRKELHLNTTDNIKITHSCFIHIKYLPAFHQVLSQKDMTLEKLKMQYSQCADGIDRFFGNISVTFSFISEECCVFDRLFWLRQAYQDELVNAEELKYDSLIKRPKF